MKKIINLIKSMYRLFTRPAARIGLGILVAGGFAGGIVFWQMFNLGMDTTNQQEFCLSCHTMKDNLLPELQKTVHWQNRSGVRAGCPDCHVPHGFTDKVARKMQASREVLAQFTGVIDTREKFKAHRLTLAQREWTRLKANNSQECRNCHDYKHMDFSKMRITSQMIMRGAAERDVSCIECHRGIAHQLPDIKGIGNPAFDSLISEARSITVADGESYYSVIPQDIYADETLTKVIGSIEVTAPVKVIQKKNDSVHVELTLWRKNKGFGRVWYSQFGLNIVELIFSKDVARDKELIKVLETKTDELTGLEWQKVTAKVWIKDGGLINSLEVVWDIARGSYSGSCSVCHRQPAESGHDANQWIGLFSGMVGFTSMDDATAKLVLKYLQLHSSDFARGQYVAGSPETAIQSARP